MLHRVVYKLVEIAILLKSVTQLEELGRGSEESSNVSSSQVVAKSSQCLNSVCAEAKRTDNNVWVAVESNLVSLKKSSETGEVEVGLCHVEGGSNSLVHNWRRQFELGFCGECYQGECKDYESAS